MTITAVIPTLNAAKTLPATLQTLKGISVLVSDGGSEDGTVAVAEASGATVVHSPPGRGRQLYEGALAASGDWLLFLHGDTVLEEGWEEEARAFMGTSDKAAYFRFALDDQSPKARRVERRVAWRCRVLGLPYGDQGLLMSRRLYESLGGYNPSLPLMEDVDLVRRIGKGRLVGLLQSRAVTSAERFRQGGYWLRPLRNVLCLCLFLMGLPISLVRRLYG